MSKKVLIVIDVQRCFLPGGNLAVNGPDSGKIFADKVNDLLINGGFSDVFLTQDVHHPENVSLGNMHPNTSNASQYSKLPSGAVIRTGMYKNYEKAQQRRWAKQEDLDNQMLWPRHCVISPDDEYYPEGYNKVSGRQPNRTKDGQAYGSDLAFALDKYKNSSDPFYQEASRPTIYHVYKGFDKTKDSYSAIADAVGAEDPFIARVDGKTQAPDTSQKFTKKLTELNKEGGISDIYICGIATDFCVYQTTMDLIDLWLFSLKGQQTNKPKIHLIYDLTRTVFPSGHPLHKSEQNYIENVSSLLKSINAPGDINTYFEIDKYKDVMKSLSGKNVNALPDPSNQSFASNFTRLFGNTTNANFEGGRRNKTRKAHKGNCGCSKCWPKPKKGGKSTRKPKGHKNGCKCPICKRR